MHRFMLDTTVLIDLSRRRPGAMQGVWDLVGRDGVLGACAISLAEFYSGAPQGRDPAMDRFLRRLAYWSISPYVATRAGDDRFRMARRGVTLSMTDALIAATARARQAAVVTANVRHFPLEDVRVIDTRAWG